LFSLSPHSADPPAFHALLLRHTETVLPFVYTPTVGEACQKYHTLDLTPTGLYLTPEDAATPGAVAAKLRAFAPPGSASTSAPTIIILTDGERILGLGDLGAGGLGIAEGKALLYTAAGGVPPTALIPVCLDVGTNNEALRTDPAYRGVRAARAPPAVLDALVEAVFVAVREWRPRSALIHFEDFGSASAFRLLHRYAGGSGGLPAFNDDVEGTAAVALAAILAGLRLSGGELSDQRLLFFGAGEAGTGIGELVAAALVARCPGLDLARARARCVFVDSAGLVTARRPGDLAAHKRPFAHDLPQVKSLLEAVRLVRPTVLVGVSAVAGAFNADVLAEMASLNRRPIILPLSNPTHLAECSLAQALDGTGGRGIVATGSPFPPHAGRAASQANNAYIFPAVGAACLATRATRLGPGAFLAAAECLALQATAEEQDAGLLFPRFSRIADVSAAVAAAVGGHLIAEGVGEAPEGVAYAGMGVRPPGVSALEAHMRTRMVNLPGPSRL
jgi:malate dehydrogenase (oxaloacetate-decarboxylating)(NADP+)